MLNELSAEDLHYLQMFIEAEKTLNFIIINKNTNFEDILCWNEEADNILEQNILLINSKSVKVITIFESVEPFIQQGFMSFCKKLVEEIKLITN